MNITLQGNNEYKNQTSSAFIECRRWWVCVLLLKAQTSLQASRLTIKRFGSKKAPAIFTDAKIVLGYYVHINIWQTIRPTFYAKRFIGKVWARPRLQSVHIF